MEWEDGKSSFHSIVHTHTHTHATCACMCARTHSKIKAENLAKKKNPTPVPSKLILGREVIAKDPNKKPTTGCKRLQVFN